VTQRPEHHRREHPREVKTPWCISVSTLDSRGTKDPKLLAVFALNALPAASISRATSVAGGRFAFELAVRQHVEGLVIGEDGLTRMHHQSIVELVARNRLPTVYSVREFVEAGGRIACAVNCPDLYLRFASLIDKFFRGAKPGELRGEQPTKYELIINSKPVKTPRPDDPAHAPRQRGDPMRRAEVVVLFATGAMWLLGAVAQIPVLFGLCRLLLCSREGGPASRRPQPSTWRGKTRGLGLLRPRSRDMGGGEGRPTTALGSSPPARAKIAQNPFRPGRRE